MKYSLYILTMILLFVGGMIVGNVFLPEQTVVRAASVSVPELDTSNPVFTHTNRESVSREVELLNNALTSCPVVVDEEKDRIINHIKLWLALDDFELKKSVLELEMAKNVDSNRPTAQFLQAAQEYNTAREKVEKMAAELFPVQEEQTQASPEDTPSKEFNADYQNPRTERGFLVALKHKGPILCIGPLLKKVGSFLNKPGPKDPGSF